MTLEHRPTLLEVSGLKTYFRLEEGIVKAVDGVDFRLLQGEVLGIVGESGSGKTVTALSIMRLIRPPGRIESGQIKLDGQDLLALSGDEMRKLRGKRISMIFQQPQSSLNPVIPVGDQLAEVYRIHSNISKREHWEKSIDLLRQVGIADADIKAHAYPHEMSGGQAQRIMIAMALALNPEMLIADEPTTALDVTIQAQILDLIRDLRNRLSTSVILITHDLGIVAEMADFVAVMYAGQIVEQARMVDLFNCPLHPYTQGLINSIPVLGEKKERLDVIPGNVPNPLRFPDGCKFHPRCSLASADDTCRSQDPGLKQVRPGHWVACWQAEGY